MIKISNLNKIYKSKKRKQCHALKDINLTLPDSGLVFVLGKSGSGKSTLLNLIGGLDNVTSGSIEVDGNNLAKFRENDFCNYRNTHIGFIFQDYHLIDELTVYENIVLSLNLRRLEDKDDVKNALARVDLAGYEDRYPSELSGGEQQRVAIARAIVKKPRIILADEPTGNLDTNTAKAIVELLKELSKECLILIVSHNVNDANSYADRIIELKKGEIISDMSRNPEFPDEVTLLDGEMIYPDGVPLSDGDIDLLNEHPSKKIVKRKDKFITTKYQKKEGKKVKIENKNLSFMKETRLSGKFLKNKMFAIAASSLMVAAIMVIMALAQTIVAFDGGKVISEELDKNSLESLLFIKGVSDEDAAQLDGDFRAMIEDGDIDAIMNSGYKGKIYPVLNVSVPVSQYKNIVGIESSVLRNSLFINESLGTMIVDQDFLAKKFGEVDYLASAEDPSFNGLIITDYLADCILATNANYFGKTYEDVIGKYVPSGWALDTVNVKAIIKTGYREQYAEMINKINTGELSTFQELYADADFKNFVNDLYDRLGFSYTDDKNFLDNAYKYRVFYSRNKLVINDMLVYEDTTSPLFSFIKPSNLPPIKNGEIIMRYNAYNNLFGTSYDPTNLSSFVPHKITLSSYMFSDVDNSDPLYTVEVTIAALQSRVTDTIIASPDDTELLQLVGKGDTYYNALYLDGVDGAGEIIDLMDELNYDHQSYAVESIHTMTKVVDVFVPIFKIIALFLCAAAVFILMSFSTKMIKSKMHEIGILKALGTKNSTIGAVFGLQVVLIAILTCVLSTVGYYYIVGVANDVLFESMKRFATGNVVLDLEFFTFMPRVALEDCALVSILAIISMLIPMIKIKAIKPVKIIKAKE